MPSSCARSPAQRNPSSSGADSPMRNRLSCSSLPRLRSQPIQRCSLSLHDASAMKKKEAPRSVPAIQFLDPAGHDVDILCVLRHALPRCVSKIGQERKAQIRIRVSEVTNFKTVEFVLDRAPEWSATSAPPPACGNHRECLLFRRTFSARPAAAGARSRNNSRPAPPAHSRARAAEIPAARAISQGTDPATKRRGAATIATVSRKRLPK